MTKKYIKNWLIENHSKEVLKPLREKNFKLYLRQLYLRQLVHSAISSEDLDFIVEMEVGHVLVSGMYNAAKTPEEVERISECIACVLVIYFNKYQILALLKECPDVNYSMLAKYRK